MAITTQPSSSLTRQDARYRYRKTMDRVATACMALCTLVTVAMLAVILGYVVIRGITSINWAFFTALPKPVGETGGGIANAIVGTLIIVGMGALLAVPIGVGAAVFVNEFNSRKLRRLVRFIADVLTGVPSIVVGLFVYTMVVTSIGGFSAFAGALAYAIIMIPIILISAHEALRLVPSSLREAALALGVPRWRVILSVVLPTSRRALTTGLVLATARAVGETAPMIFTSFGNAFWNWNIFKPMATVPLVIYRYATGPYDDWHRQAWAASFVLVVVVLLASLFTRLLLRGKYED